ncbi:SMI1/KNR4 family protein [Blastopirellula sp. JC732]|uniref:SMI1/KNR4 family protein n=1 Tax=Blastopirellula sediminis TaxID=2894196 RepID=A0A9X1MJZ0_9BACT|nr:SMI1/KNR4 family protein [Blastopirellula sediminis]MCC9609092.1 SMI1/KNR4 family protein [Blastopirellula sediminis]MCC9628131.1 SMI1/KNR4 family protein [Blastopirellula sediminis]
MLDEVLTIIPIPEFPIDVDENAMKATQLELGVELPSDFLAYARVFGSGTIVIDETYDFEIYSPGRSTFIDFVRKFTDRQNQYRRATGNVNMPFGLFPEPEGLLPFGHRDDMYFAWKTKGDPSEWTIVVIWQFEPGGYQDFAIGFCEFLSGILRQKLRLAPFKTIWDDGAEIQFEPEVYGG